MGNFGLDSGLLPVLSHTREGLVSSGKQSYHNKQLHTVYVLWLFSTAVASRLGLPRHVGVGGFQLCSF